MGAIKFLLKWTFLIFRATLRWLFVDCGGKDYFKAKWEPSRDRWTHFSYGPEDDPDGLYDESSHGDDFPGIFIVPAIALSIALSPIWVPVLLWSFSEEHRKRMLKWAGADK